MIDLIKERIDEIEIIFLIVEFIVRNADETLELIISNFEDIFNTEELINDVIVLIKMIVLDIIFLEKKQRRDVIVLMDGHLVRYVQGRQNGDAVVEEILVYAV